jgi:hypothetical protein
MAAYLYRPTGKFSTQLEKIRKNDPPGYKRVMSVIDRLLETPGDADGKMQGAHHGKLKKYVGRRDYRILYHWCELCRKANKKQDEVCVDCETIPDQSVIVFDIYHKSDMKKI